MANVDDWEGMKPGGWRVLSANVLADNDELNGGEGRLLPCTLKKAMCAQRVSSPCWYNTQSSTFGSHQKKAAPGTLCPSLSGGRSKNIRQ